MVVAVYDGAEGTVTLEKKLHAGSVYSSEWSPDGTQIATASADKTVKV
jgi:WD40 repeat protein